MISMFPVMVPLPRSPRLLIEVPLSRLKMVVGGAGKWTLFLIAISPLSIVVCCILERAISPRLILLLDRVATILAPIRARIDIISLHVFCILTWCGPMAW